MRTFSPLHGVTSNTLSNGLRVYLKEDHRWSLVSIQSWVRVGSIDEQENEAGMAHVIEHMVFKGTQRHTATEISRWVESEGGTINAETSREYTHYYIDVPSAGTAQAVSLLGEMLHRATFIPDEWTRECPVILEEMKRRNDDPDVAVWDSLGQAVFEHERLRRPVIGSIETVSRFSRDHLWQFYRRHYTADQTVVVIVGDFDSKQIIRWLEEALGSMAVRTSYYRETPQEPAFKPKDLHVLKAVQQSYAAFGFPTPPSSSEDHEPLDLLAIILGEGRNSRLVHTLREQKKLVWSVSVGNFTHEGPGLFGVFIECDSAKRSAARAALLRLLEDLRRHPPTVAELARAKNMIQMSWLQGHETYHNQASSIGSYALDHQLNRLKNYLPRITALTPAHLRDIIHRYLHPLVMSSVVIEA